MSDTLISSLIVLGCIATVIFIYFQNNPLGLSGRFVTRRFINWFPLGMTYAFMYMARYNLTVAKIALGKDMTNQDFGIIFGVGTFVYAFSFLINGPLVDKIGGKKGMLIGAIGSSVANVAIGYLVYLMVTHQAHFSWRTAFSTLYGVNMYFQSFGAVSIIKVKAYWFHVRERGVFGAIFGTLISLGVYFAFDWGHALAGMVTAHPTGEIGWFHHLILAIFAPKDGSVNALWALFYLPAAIMLAWALVDLIIIKDTPEEAGFPPFDTADASSGHMDEELTTLDLLKKVFASKLMLTVAAIGVTVGVLRTGIMNWYLVFAKETNQPHLDYFSKNWGLLVCVFGIVGGFFGGWMSDKFFQSRRGPPAAICSAIMFFLAVLITLFLFKAPLIVAWSAVSITLFVIGAHSLMAGTAAPDFGGRKATATCSGVADGFVYLGGSIQSFAVGYLTDAATFPSLNRWYWWPVFLLPFAVLGTMFAVSMWNQLPAATRKYIAERERDEAAKLSQ